MLNSAIQEKSGAIVTVCRKIWAICNRHTIHWMVATSLGLWASSAVAWSNHTLCTWYAIDKMPVLAGQQVSAEPLEQFLQKESLTLPAFLDQEESWAQAHLKDYAPRPAALRFTARTGEPLQRDFLLALRVNAAMPMPLFRQLRPGVSAPPGRQLDWHAVTFIRDAAWLNNYAFESISANEPVAVADVIASAANEPDYGMDLSLWEDNETVQGKRSGLGPQPFGNPRFANSAQAPFHMGFYHEADLIYLAAPFLKRTYPESRIHLYSQLARFAFEHGHPYWGYRFTGWAMHYAQDLTQPYHARVLPGVGVARMLWINLLDLAGVHGAKRDAINLVANRHTILENYQLSRMLDAFKSGRTDDPLILALQDVQADSEKGAPETVHISDFRNRITQQSSDAADALDRQLERSFPWHYIGDPNTVLDEVTDFDLYPVAQSYSSAQDARLAQLVALQLRQFGMVSRAMVRSALNRP